MVCHLPVKNVEEAVESEHGDVMTGEVLDDAHLVEHDDLGDEGDGLEPHGETQAEEPHWVPAHVDDARENQSHWDQDLEVRELIAKGVVGRAEGHLILHEVDDESRRRDEKELHQRVVDAHEVPE